MTDDQKVLNLMKKKTVKEIKTIHHPFDLGVVEIYFYLDDGSIVGIANKAPGPSFIIWDESNEDN